MKQSGKTMGMIIARLRKAQGMTQAELAEKMQVTDKRCRNGNGIYPARIFNRCRGWRKFSGSLWRNNAGRNPSRVVSEANQRDRRSGAEGAGRRDGHRADRVFCFKDAETHEWVPAGRIWGWPAQEFCFCGRGRRQFRSGFLSAFENQRTTSGCFNKIHDAL